MSCDFNLMKVFNASKLPEDLYEYLADYFEVSNDSYYHWFTYDGGTGSRSGDRVNRWLLSKGAINKEQVLLKFSW